MRFHNQEDSVSATQYVLHQDSWSAHPEAGYMPEGVPLYTDLTVKEFVTYMAEIKQVERKTRKEKVEKDVYKRQIRKISN